MEGSDCYKIVSTVRRQRCIKEPCLVESVGKGFICTRRSTKHFPVIHNKFMSSRGLLTLRNDFERSGKFDRRLQL